MGYMVTQNSLPECWTVWIEMVFPRNAGFAEFKPVRVFHRVHTVTNVVADLRLQFPHKITENMKVFSRQKSGGLHVKEQASDCPEFLVEAIQTAVGSEFPFKMWSSQVASNTGDLVRAASLPRAVAWPVSAYKVSHCYTQEKSDFEVDPSRETVRHRRTCSLM